MVAPGQLSSPPLETSGLGAIFPGKAQFMSMQFTDKKGRVWDLSLDIRNARIIDKSDFTAYWDKKFSILNLEPDLINKLLTDGPFLFAVIWAMVQDQVTEKYQVYQRWSNPPDQNTYTVQGELPPRDSFPISPKDAEAAEAEFVSGVNGPTIEAARTAIMEALGDFFPEQRTALSILRDQVTSLGIKVGKKLQEAVPLLNECLDEELDARVAILKAEFRKTLDQKSGGVSSQSPAILELASSTSGSQG